MRNETQGCWVICLRLQTSVTERAWDQDNPVEAPFISFYGTLLPGTWLCHHFSLFLLVLLFMCLCVYLYFMFVYIHFFLLFPGGSVGEISAFNTGDPDSIPGSGRFPGEGNGNPLQYSCLENSTDKRSLAGYCPRDPKESDRTEGLTLSHFTYISVICMHLFI